MTPADFDRPFIDEPAPRPVEHNRAEPEPPHETIAEPQPAAQPNTESEDKSSGERKRGWWKRVLS
jgi:hypothetical protein